MSSETSIAHKRGMNWIGQEHYPDGLVPWRDGKAPDVEKAASMDDCIGRIRGCGYCGSMHPADVAAAIRAGAKGSWADFKYGWPHKAYFDGVPNPHAGMLEIRSSSSSPNGDYCVEHTEKRFNERTGERNDRKWYSPPAQPASATTYGKFYSVHLQDASPEDRALIEQHLGLHFDFNEDGSVAWRKAVSTAGEPASAS